MPDGIVQWFDDGASEGRIVRGSREFPVSADEIDPDARASGAVVHFDIRREPDGVERAVHVSLRRGTRVSPRQRRFGSLAGARRPDATRNAPFPRPHPEFEHARFTHPHAVAREWARLLEDDAAEEASSLYAPEAVVHLPDRDISGRSRIRDLLAGSSWRGAIEPDVSGRDPYVQVRWHGIPGDLWSATWLLVRHGEIVEQWAHGAVPLSA